MFFPKPFRDFEPPTSFQCWRFSYAHLIETMGIKCRKICLKFLLDTQIDITAFKNLFFKSLVPH